MEVVLQPQRWPLSSGGYQDSLNGRRQLKRLRASLAPFKVSGGAKDPVFPESTF